MACLSGCRDHHGAQMRGRRAAFKAGALSLSRHTQQSKLCFFLRACLARVFSDQTAAPLAGASHNRRAVDRELVAQTRGLLRTRVFGAVAAIDRLKPAQRCFLTLAQALAAHSPLAPRQQDAVEAWRSGEARVRPWTGEWLAVSLPQKPERAQNVKDKKNKKKLKKKPKPKEAIYIYIYIDIFVSVLIVTTRMTTAAPVRATRTKS